MNRKHILLINHGKFEDEFLDHIVQSVVNELHYPVQIADSEILLDEYYDPGRRQYDGNRLLKDINSISTPDIMKRIALFRVDLFIPILTYIFGQAAFKGETGIVSVYRLRNELYGIKKDDTLLLNRFTKVIIHELGHTFGLIHCHTPNCVMRSSTYVEDIDQKSRSFCSSCRSQLLL